MSMIGVDSRFQGRGYGGDLLVDCLKRPAMAADALGIAIVILDVLDCGSPERVAKRLALYIDYGFKPLPSNLLRLILSIATGAHADEYAGCVAVSQRAVVTPRFARQAYQMDR